MDFVPHLKTLKPCVEVNVHDPWMKSNLKNGFNAITEIRPFTYLLMTNYDLKRDYFLPVGENNLMLAKLFRGYPNMCYARTNAVTKSYGAPCC